MSEGQDVLPFPDEKEGKQCSKCGERKTLGEYGRDKRRKDGRRSHCMACDAASCRERRWAKRGIPETDFPRLHAEAIAATLHSEGMRARAKAVGGKWCPNCDDILPRRAFYVDARKADGLNGWCGECNGEAVAAYRQTPEGRAASIAKDARREARKRGQPVDGSGIPDWLNHHEETDTWNCHLCGGGFLPGDVIEWDHRDPLSDRFTGDEPKAGHVVANLAAAHKACNNSRSDTPLDVWHERIGVPDGVV
ncbi:hypothetical protein ACWGKS_26440 [Nocardiopsis sp. NPDC055879]